MVMKKFLIIVLVIIAGAMFAYPMQASATYIASVDVTAQCVEDGTGGYDVTYEVCFTTTAWGSAEYHDVGVAGKITLEGDTVYTIDETIDDIETPGNGLTYSGCEKFTVDLDACGDYTIEITARITDVSPGLPADDGQINSYLFTCTCVGDEGCTPGYWKNHLVSWVSTGYSPTDSWEDVFGFQLPGFPILTLNDAIRLNGNKTKVEALARHATAGLLSASHPDVDYPVGESAVIGLAEAGDKDTLASYNEMGCPLGGGPAFRPIKSKSFYRSLPY